MMKRGVYIVFGAVLGALLSYAGTWVIGAMFGPLYASEDDMARNVKIFLGVTALLIVLGGYVGNRLYRRR